MALRNLRAPQQLPLPFTQQAADWFEEAGLKLVAAALEALSRAGGIREEYHEDEISVLLQEELNRRIRRQQLSFSVVYQSQVIDAEDVRARRMKAKEAPTVDLALYRNAAEGDVHLSIEAKVLVEQPLRSWERSKQAQRYVQEGMRKFVDGRYARGASMGVMLGYVRIGIPRNLVKDINRWVGQDNLPCQQPLQPCPTSRRCMSDHYVSLHPRAGERFTLHHLLANV